MRLLAVLLMSACVAFTPVEAYGQITPAIDNAEIANLFKTDQSVRKNLKPAQFKDRGFITRMTEGDRMRRERALSCCRFRGHQDKVFLRPEDGDATTKVQP